MAASNGGTQHRNPQAHNCTLCGLIFDSASSLQVHQHYYHETMNRWNNSSTTNTTINNVSNSPTDSDNNNQPAIKHHTQTTHHITVSAENSPPSSTIAAAADSSDNQPSTPQPDQVANTIHHHQQHYQPEMHAYPPYHVGYDQHYYPHTIEYGTAPLPPPPLAQIHAGQQIQQQQQQQSSPAQPEYKTVPSTRYHPYMTNNNNNNNTNSSNNNNASTQVNKNGMSPKVVSSTGGSPMGTIFDNANNSAQSSSSPQVPPGQPTPSPSPKQCDKCGMVCETAAQMSEHCARAHPDRHDEAGNNEIQSYNAFGISYTKEEPSSDILDLDSQKMVYPPQHPSTMHPSGLHPLQSMQRHPMMWSPHDSTGYVHQGGYPTIKPEYPPTPPIKNEFQQSSVHQQIHTIPTNTIPKPFNGENGPDGVQGSGQDFPSTTTTQDANSFRTFEPPTSSLPSSVKSTSWKSNEARRPKTYNCTACNKWFTSSGHLKRHYNTTLHKNAVKSSGAPDPALTPISHHHHPNRDPNYNGKVRRNAMSQQPLQQPVPPPEPPRSPEYTPQFSLPAFGTNQGFQQYGIHSANGVHPNGVAGPSVLASQPRGLLIYSNNMAIQQQQSQQIPEPIHSEQLPPQQQPSTAIIITNSPLPTIIPDSRDNMLNTMEHYNTHINPSITNTSIPVSYQITELPNYLLTIGNQQQQQPQNQQHNHTQNQEMLQTESEQQAHSMIQMYDDYGEPREAQKPLAIYTRVNNQFHNSVYQGDIAPYSPDLPQEMYSNIQQTQSQTQPQQLPQSITTYETECRPLTPLQAAIAPSVSPAPNSPSITSSSGDSTIGHSENEPLSMPMPIKVIQTADLKKGEFRCLQCDKTFYKMCYLTQHNKTFHSGDKPHKCQRCGKRFDCEESQQEHFAKHAGEKPFKCEICPKQFNHKTDLRRHMCCHTGSKPFCCDECGKGFIRKDHMIKHTLTHRKKEVALAHKRAMQRSRQMKKVKTYDLIKNEADNSNASSCTTGYGEGIFVGI